jgi:cell division protein FtsW
MIMFEPYRLQRMTTFLDPRADASGAGWQIVQATLGLGNGGLTGVGLGNGTVKSFTPEASTDMIASVIGEELGLLGIVATVAAFAAFAVLGYRIAIRCRDPFGRYLGATSLIAGQAFVNLGAVLSMLPLTGVPLPLISVGGSSLVVMLALVGVMLNVANSESGAAAKAKPRRKSADAKPKQQQQPAAAKPPRPDRRRRHGGARRTGTGGGKRAAG